MGFSSYTPLMKVSSRKVVKSNASSAPLVIRVEFDILPLITALSLSSNSQFMLGASWSIQLKLILSLYGSAMFSNAILAMPEYQTLLRSGAIGAAFLFNYYES